MRLFKARPVRHQLARRALLRIDGRHIPITLRLNPRARRLIVKVHPAPGEGAVGAPPRRGLDHALDFAKSERDWILKRLEHVPPAVTLGLGAEMPFTGEMHVIRRAAKGRAPV